MVEGWCGIASRDDASDSAFQIVQHVACRHPQHIEPLFDEPAIALLVAVGPVTTIVRLTVNFDGEPPFQAGKVESVGSDRMLSPKLEAARTEPERTPEQNLRKIARSALAFGQPEGSVARCENPSTKPLRVAVPLPVPGRYGRYIAHILNTPKRASFSRDLLLPTSIWHLALSTE